MIGSSIPGIATDVWRADTTARLRVAAEGREAAAMRRDLRVDQAEDRRTHRATRGVVLRRIFWHPGRLAHGSRA
jgi:hypothetical protein